MHGNTHTKDQAHPIHILAAQAACEAMYTVIRVLESAGPDLNFPLWPEIVRPPCYVGI